MTKYSLAVLSIGGLLMACSHTPVLEKTGKNYKISKIENSDWEKSGLKEGDVIMRVKGEGNLPIAQLKERIAQALKENSTAPNIEVLRKEKGEDSYETVLLANQVK